MKLPKLKMEDRQWMLLLLFLLLTSMIMSNANLFAKGSNLEGWERTIGAYFTGFVFEAGIFFSIKAGSRATGYVFAIFSFFWGVLFDDQWGEFLIAVNRFDWDITDLPDHSKFLSTISMRLGASILALVLTERYLTLLGEHRMSQKLKITEKMQDLALLEHSVSTLKEQEARLEQSRNTLIREESIKQAVIDELQSEIKSLRAQKGKLNGHSHESMAH